MLHVAADKPGRRRARGVRRVTALAIGSPRLGIAGVADLVEFSGESGCEIAFPVEYKRGVPKRHRADEVQLCAQALCLEDMTGQSVPAGALFYAETKRRTEIVFDSDLRAFDSSTIEALRDVFSSRLTPLPAQQRSRCRACSLVELCKPEIAAAPSAIGGGGWSTACWREIADEEVAEHRLYHNRRRKPSQGRREPRCRGGRRGTGARAVHMLSSLVLFGVIYISPALMGACAASRHNHCFARPCRPLSGARGRAGER